MSGIPFSEIREAYYKALVRECFGPLPTDSEQVQRESLKEVPTRLYLTGMLFPQNLTHIKAIDSETESETLGHDQDPVSEDAEQRGGEDESDPMDGNEQEEMPLNLANEKCPAAMGMTVKLAKNARLKVTVTFGTYHKEKRELPHPMAGKKRNDDSVYPNTKTISIYKRTHHASSREIDLGTLSMGSNHKVHLDDRGELSLTLRPNDPDTINLSIMVINQAKASFKRTPSFDQILFQSGLRVESCDHDPIFHPIEQPTAVSDDEEHASLSLLYRGHHAYGSGHGCAVIWALQEKLPDNRARRLETSFIPSYEAKVIAPREASSPIHSEHKLNMSMAFLSDNEEKNKIEIMQSLKAFASDYQIWISIQQEALTQLEPYFIAAAKRHLATAETCLARIRYGISLLEKDEKVMLAFQLANRAMLMQFHHTNICGNRKDNQPLPDHFCSYQDPVSWRPFQLGFLLMNLQAFSDPHCLDRKTVDLIWFPTGGGKTEAYLGLTAYAIILRRLLNPKNAGTQVIMRYTLRLLTTQQFQRASTLILALEQLRRNRYWGVNLGEEAISVGLWAGASLTPNYRRHALKSFKEFKKRGNQADNVFQIMNCLWCGENWNDHKTPGYADGFMGKDRTVIYCCPNKKCAWYDDDVPIRVIDEDIYAKPPTLILGTVDKFAQIAWRDQVGRLFGIGTEFDPPEMIIQDELHLISGPLGTMVGLYETAIERLCSLKGISPKIVASTATICHAKDQCLGLYGERNIIQFPPQGLRAGDSYFALEDHKRPGRLYVGVFPSSIQFQKDAQKNLVYHLLQNLRTLTDDKPEPAQAFAAVYGTLVWYFNSLRELGHAVTLCQASLGEFFASMQYQREIPPDQRRKVRECGELTSRRTAAEIPRILQQMAVDWCVSPKSGNYPLDILLATNMIAVGIDIARLGLMLINGQPKTTAEYIQSSSRVGRTREAPGMVVTLYHPGKNRDRSHFEQFVAYHQSLYKHVEPTSVTPFSPPARERGLRGILIGLVRQAVGLKNPELLHEYEDDVAKEITWLLDRVQQVDPEERLSTEQELEGWLQKWKDMHPHEYGPMFGKVGTKTLAYPFGQHRDSSFQGKAWPIPTSLRNVDATCRAKILETSNLDDLEAEY